MSLTEILNEVGKMSPAEQKQILNFLLERQSNGETSDVEERRALHHRRLLEKGLLKQIPARSNIGVSVARNFQPVSIAGKPLSETIIEERR